MSEICLFCSKKITNMQTSNIKERVAHNIKKLRELNNYTQEYMSTELEMSTTGYGDIERNISDFTFSRLVKIAEKLNTTIFKLLEFDERTYYDVHHNHNGIVNHHYSSEEIKLLVENNDLLRNENQRLKEEISRMKMQRN